MIKLFTHNDLDGIGCAILGQLAFENIDIEFCGYGDINKKVEEFIQSGDFNNYSHTYITDISITEELIEKIIRDYINFNLDENVTLIDHHPTAKYLYKYGWTIIKINNELGKCSGTSLFYEYLLDNKYSQLEKDVINEFVEIVRRYDTWEWKTVFNDEVPNILNNLLAIYGRKIFINNIMYKLKTEDKFQFDKTDLLLLEINKENKKLYFENKCKELIEYDIQNYHVGIVFAEQYISELGNYLAEQFKELDFIVLIGNKTISYRGIKDNIDLGVFAKQFGGGGHPKASGSRINKKNQLDYIKSLFN
ncbi:DHH family phosphoesterase [Clostridium novyi]|uniref:Phosphoesterase n=1 Tax=Clostridium novyi B str. ATCC 27606 TaxID=1443123 RepID=A0AA40IRN2_CLONO|nr:DHHA1 domain-containing protein [Clostridium novyi]KEI11488.1 hypothetical protein Z959_p0054 [Clostridium novyi B str. ATCC 27606]